MIRPQRLATFAGVTLAAFAPSPASAAAIVGGLLSAGLAYNTRAEPSRPRVMTDGGVPSSSDTQQTRLPVGDTRKPTVIKEAQRVTTGDLAALAMCAHRYEPADVWGWYTHEFDDVLRQWICSNVQSVIARLSPHCEYTRGECFPLHPSDDLWVGEADTGPSQTTLVTDGGQSVDDTGREENRQIIKDQIRAAKERNGFWPAKGPLLESLDYEIEDAHAALDAWDELLEDDEIETFEGREGTQVRIVETDDEQRTLTDGGTDQTIDISPKRKHRVEVGEDTTPGGFFTIAHPQSAFAGPSVASFDEQQAREIYDALDEFFGGDDR